MKITALKAFGPSVVITPYKRSDRKTEGGIHIPDNVDMGDMPMGKIVSVGDVEGVSEGDEIIYSGRGYQVDDLRIVPADQILAIVPPEGEDRDSA